MLLACHSMWTLFDRTQSRCVPWALQLALAKAAKAQCWACDRHTAQPGCRLFLSDTILNCHECYSVQQVSVMPAGA